MSRLDSFYRRITAQRDCLDHAASLIADLDGPVLELGLGNGRTYDHLQALFPERDVYAFDRRMAADPASAPDEAHFIEGDFRETMPTTAERIGRRAALIHCDFGSGRPERDREVAAWLAVVLPALLAPGGVIVSDQALEGDALAPQPVPDSVELGRYFLYKLR